ncbi:MAG: hypothetical protein AB9866_08205 [Syntrophobacteraceae bacterium]
MRSGWSKFVLAALALLLVSGAGTAWAQLSFNGNMCWTFQVHQTDEGPDHLKALLRLHIKQLDGVTYVVHGRVIVDGDTPVIVMGNAADIGTKNIYLNLTATNTSKPERSTGILRGQLSLTTLNGSFWMIDNSFDPAEKKFEQGYTAGSLTLVACP